MGRSDKHKPSHKKRKNDDQAAVVLIVMMIININTQTARRRRNQRQDLKEVDTMTVTQKAVKAARQSRPQARLQVIRVM